MKKITIAIQKSGRLTEDTFSLLKDCGISINNGRSNLKATAEGFPVEFLLLRDDDIPQYVSDGIAQAGILGLNEVLEKNKPVEVLLNLGYSRCRMSVAVPKELDYNGLQYLQGKKIATSYPNLLNKFLKDNRIEAEIHEISGSVEIAPGIGLADAIFDIVSSGGTLLSNGLKEVETGLTSEAVLISQKNLEPEYQQLIEKLIFRIQSVRKARANRYILLNCPNDRIEEITKIIPGMKSPTILPLAKEGWSSLHSVISKIDFWEIIDKLKENGAEGILVVPIELMVS